MKKISSVVCLSVLVLLLLVSTVIGSDWVEYWRSDKGNVFSYNKVSIKHRTTDIVQVRNKIVFSVEGKEEFIQQRKNGGFWTKRDDKTSHILSLHEIDCKKKMYQILSYNRYNTVGNVLESIPVDEENWNYIPPDSMIDILRKIVCK